MSFRWWSSSVSDRGRRRKVNEDASLSLPECGIWVVADGMGGHTRGDLASQYVIESFQDFPQANSIDEIATYGRACLQRANDRVIAEVAKMEPGHVMGSTVVVLLVYERHYVVLWVGDSRVYRLRSGKLRQLTKDHSVVQQMIDDGEIDASQARGHPASNRITRAVGVSSQMHVDEARGSLRDGDTLLLCSDGLIIEVDDDEIAAILDEFDCEPATQELLDLSLERGARDNVTIQVVQIEETTGVDWQSENSTAINYAFRKRLVQGVRLAATT
jgi:protein phosphatase